LKLVAQPQQARDPYVASLEQKIARLEGQWTQQQQQAQQQVQEQVLSTIDAFARDPKHPHFKTVSASMGTLMQAGEAKDLEEAYQMAVWARPDLRAQLLAEQQAQQNTQAQARQRTEKARAKAVSVRGGPGGFTPAPDPKQNDTVRGALQAAFAEAAGRI
jgi:hypothetical protein